MHRDVTFIVFLTLALAAPTIAQNNKQKADAKTKAAAKGPQQDRNYPPDLPLARAETYKSIDGADLKIYIYEPAGHKATNKTPAIVFFFGGGWTNGSPSQFDYQCQYLASRGMVAMTADYRVASRHNVKAVACVSDAKSAIRWVRSNAARLGVDPHRIVASGGSAGGHIAACTAVIDQYDEPAEDRSISSKPDALVLFNPAMAMAPIGDETPSRDPATWQQRTGVDPKSISPAHHASSTTPPTIMYFGTDDRLLAGAQAFADQAKKLGARCQVMTWEGRGHGFFNLGRGDNADFTATLGATDEFLASLGYLKGKPTVDPFMKSIR